MKSIIKSLVDSNCQKKWLKYKSSYEDFFRERDVFYDQVIDFINDFYLKFKEFPNWETFKKELVASSEGELLKYIENVMGDVQVRCFNEPVDFYTHLSACEKMYLELDMVKVVKDFEVDLNGATSKRVEDLVSSVDLLVSNLHKVKNRVSKDEKSVSGYLYGDKSISESVDFYERIEKKRLCGEDVFYSLGFEKFSDIRLEMGNLVFFGAFTSQGKSVLLRQMARRLSIKYGLNVLFFTCEMSYKEVKILFELLHANDKGLFPDTPVISGVDYNTGALSDEQKSFLLNVSNVDLYENENYGVLYLEQTNKTKYTLDDLRVKIAEIEQNVMPVNVVIVDYLSMLHPLGVESRRRPDMDDYNQMIKDFKNMTLTHRSRDGVLAPFLAMSAAQISRHAYNKCMKEDGFYDLSAMASYSEIERSGDVLFSCLMDPDRRKVRKICLQNLKHRNGALVVDPVDLRINLDIGLEVYDDSVERTHMKSNFESVINFL